jgi:hydrogenase expression/formation protein HypD
MAPFTMCAECRREYDDPLNRRFHAQPNACPACGPQLIAMTPQRREITTNNPIRFAARALRAQLIVAVKGLGGFHLACDATSPLAVARLRQRKHREAKPLAVMVRDLAQAEERALLTAEERALLTSVERPIVLARGRSGGLVGLFLSYTPLHHLLLAECNLPLVMTSGHLSEEPTCTSNDEAHDRLHDVADLFLLHNRAIETRADDSVTRVIAGAPVILRRGRGYVPRAIRLQQEFEQPILAVGAHLKNAICIGAGKDAFLGPHIGDLESVETLKSFEASIEQMKTFVGVDPKIIAHDLHPDYFSTRYALATQQLSNTTTVAIQHHHAHANFSSLTDPAMAKQLAETLAHLIDEIGRPVAVMHVCGSHEQAIAKFGLRSLFPKRLEVIMGPGCPVCVTDVPRSRRRHRPRADGCADGHVRRHAQSSRYRAIACGRPGERRKDRRHLLAVAGRRRRQEHRRRSRLLATGFETTAVATAAIVTNNLPKNLSILSAHKYIPPVIVSEMPESRVEGFLAAGHAATITGWAVFEPFVERHRVPVVVAGFEPLDILAGLVDLVTLIRDKRAAVINTFPRCVTREGNLAAQEQLWRVFRQIGGRWRGIAHVPNGNLRLRDEFAHVDARRRFKIDVTSLWDFAPPHLGHQCICGDIMAGIRNPNDCRLFNRECTPEDPVGECMVSNEGTCKIWHLYGGVPDLSEVEVAV